MPDTYIKREPEEEYNNDLLSRSVLTRGFNSFDDQNASSMIDDSDLLDLEGLNSPELNPYSIPPNSNSNNSHLGPPPPVPPNSTTSNAHAMAAASIGFSSTTPSRPILSGSYSSKLGSTPPVPESTSPFDDFMLANSRIPSHQQQQQRALQQQQQQQQQSYGGGAMSFNNSEFQRVQGLNSANSTPIGSYEYATSPPMSSAAAAQQYKKSNLGGTTPSSLPANSPDDKQQMLLAERRRRRRESHNAVERRRRDNINEKIRELADLLPESFLTGVNNGNDGSGSSYAAVLPKDEKPNKGTILTRSVDYIRQLQQIIDDQNRRELELQENIQQIQKQTGLPVTEFQYTSAELALSKLGVGPQAAGDQSNQKPAQSQVTPDFASELDNDYYQQNPDVFSSPR